MNLAFRPAFIAVGVVAALSGFYTLYSGVSALGRHEDRAVLMILFGAGSVVFGVGLATWAARARQG